MANVYKITSTDDLDIALESARVLTGRGHVVDVIRDAFEVYDLIVHRMHDDQGRLYVGKDRDTAAEVILSMLERAAGRRHVPPLALVPSEEPA